MSASVEMTSSGPEPTAEAGRAVAQVQALIASTFPDGWPGTGALSAADRATALDRWRSALGRSGLLAPRWPQEYGGAGLGPAAAAAVEEHIALAGLSSLPWSTDFFGLSLLGPTLIHWGTDEQRFYFLPRIISGEHRWAQGYSEPDAGSDLFSLRTRARLEGDHWVIDGRKVWQTAVCDADHMFVLARTEPDQSRGRGLSFFLIDLRQPGVDVRGIVSMTGATEFGEVTMDGARTPVDHLVGGRGEGAKVALSVLGFERTSTSSLWVTYHHELHRLTRLTQERGRHRDTDIRQRIARCRTRVAALRALGEKGRESDIAGRPPGAESSMLKLYESEYHHEVTELAIDVLGADGIVIDGEPAVEGLGPAPAGSANSTATWQTVFQRARAGTIYGGTSQIQRNTLGERVLGLPPEPRVRP